MIEAPVAVKKEVVVIRKDKIKRNVREVYLHKNVNYGIRGHNYSYAPEAVLDIEKYQRVIFVTSETALIQSAFLLDDPIVNNLVLTYTSLDRVLQAKAYTHGKYIRLIKEGLMDPEAVVEFEDGEPPNTARAKPDKMVFAFPDQFSTDTFREKGRTESERAYEYGQLVRTADSYWPWLSRETDMVILAEPSEIESFPQVPYYDIPILTCAGFCKRIGAVSTLIVTPPKVVLPLAPGQKLSEDLEAALRIKMSVANNSYSEHLSPESAQAFLAKTQENPDSDDYQFYQGTLRMALKTNILGFVTLTDCPFLDEVQVFGHSDLNRAMDGDLVVVRLIKKSTMPVEEDEASDAECEDREYDANAAIEEFHHDEISAVPVAAPTNSARIEAFEMSNIGKVKAKVVSITKRAWRVDGYVGTLLPKKEGETRDHRILVCFDPRVPRIKLHLKDDIGLKNKRLLVKIVDWPCKSAYPEGIYQKILGDCGDKEVENEVILHQYGVTTSEFEEAIYRSLPPNDWLPGAHEEATRLDLRDRLVCSIDPPGCKDIDDALSCWRLEDGNFQVGVHIADVTYFVPPNGPVDLEAQNRCQTCYLVGRRIDMVPALLTTDLCSLRELVPRCAVSVLWKVNAQGEILETEYHRTLIRSSRAFTYREAQDMIDDVEDDSETATMLRDLVWFTDILKAKRMEDGALNLSSGELVFQVDEKCQPIRAMEAQEIRTTSLVEEMMLLGNCSVAQKMYEHYPNITVLRRHPQPKQDLLNSLSDQLQQKNITNFKYATNKELNASLSELAREYQGDKSFVDLIRMLTTRCMSQALYYISYEVSEESFSHYGLGKGIYTHFTSPIRRYADVLVHRLLLAAVGIHPLSPHMEDKDTMSKQANLMNQKARNILAASRASDVFNTYLLFVGQFGKKTSLRCDALVIQVRPTVIRVLVNEFKIEGIVNMDRERFELLPEDQKVIVIGTSWSPPMDTDVDQVIQMSPQLNRSDWMTSRRVGSSFEVFSHIVVDVSASDENHRYATKLSFVGF